MAARTGRDRPLSEAEFGNAGDAESGSHGEEEHRGLVEEDRRRGRGARSNRVGRFETELREAFDDGWGSLAELQAFKTDVHRETAKASSRATTAPTSALSSPSTPIAAASTAASTAIARPTHCYLGHSPGLDFETKLYAKTNAAELLEQELANPRYVPKFIALGAVTDPYQPIEREHAASPARSSRCSSATSHPVGIVTKSALVARDVDILGAHGRAAGSPRSPSP